jgi:hypothetical protein
MVEAQRPEKRAKAPQGGKPVPETLDMPAILEATKNLEEVIRDYACDNAKWWGALINWLWQTDRALNPKQLGYGHSRRDEHFEGLPLLQSGPLSRIRTVVDKAACMFGISGVIGRENLEGLLAKAREARVGADYLTMPVDPCWADELHSARAELTTVDSPLVAEPPAPLVRPQWTKPIAKKDLREALNISRNTLNARLTKGIEPVPGKIRYQAPERARKIQVAISDLPADAQTKFCKSGKQ